ncbi:hypothetical protein BCR36DRAFT_398104 [Piromyces finnis]|uniref:Uncharacterized protein n=1 Tax=Piromyces finnis TaxID=1754191 RepID=A0A1Y1V7M7_9FUNG|nr:hypothetical protein BCR36DRAFT_398104 [Piromyces finnis]|eukprot:ORX48688.1 hypothetical protein BCR36DRAFT_398104 [Piromyces finnis]
MYYYLAPNCEPAAVTNILELYDQTKSKLLQKKKAMKANTSLKQIDGGEDLSKENVLKDKENDVKKSTNSKKSSHATSNKKNLSETSLKNKGILTKSNTNVANIIKSVKGHKLAKDAKGSAVKIEILDDNKENIPPLHHNQNNATMNLQFVDYPSGNGMVGTTTVSVGNNNEEENEMETEKSSKVKKEDEEVKEEDAMEGKQKKVKPIVVNTVSDEDLEEFFRVFDDLIPMYRSSTQLQEVIFETSQKEWNEWCYKVEQCEEETHSWLDARIMFYSRRIIEYQKDWADYWNKKKQKEKELLEMSSDSICPTTPSSSSVLPSDPIKLLGSSPLPNLPLTTDSATTNTYVPFQTPDESATSMLTSSEVTPTKSNINTTTAFSNLMVGMEDMDISSFSLESNQDLLSNMSLLYDTTCGQTCFPNLDYGLDSTSSFDSIDPLSNATINNDYCNWLSSHPSSSLSVDDFIFNPSQDPNLSLLLNSAAITGSTIPTPTPTLNFLNPLGATSSSLNPALSIFDTNYATSTSTPDNIIIPPTSLVRFPTTSSTASLIDSFANLDPNQEEVKEGREEEEEEKREKGEKEVEGTKEKANQLNEETLSIPTASTDALTANDAAAMTSLFSHDLGIDLLFRQDQNDLKENITLENMNVENIQANLPLNNASKETPKMTIKTVTDALMTPTKPKECIPPTVDIIVDSSTNDDKKISEFATPLYIKPPAKDIFSTIPKSYQEMYNDKMYSLISTLERCVQDKEDFWKVMEEFTSSIHTHASVTITC